MPEQKILISKKSVKTMGKDMVRLKRQDVEGEEENGQEALLAEVKKRKEEETRLRSFREQGKKIADEAREKEKEKKTKTAALAEKERKKKEEAKRLMALQEARKRAEEEKRRAEEEEEKMAKAREAALKEKKKEQVQIIAKDQLLEKRAGLQKERNQIKEELSSLKKEIIPLEKKRSEILVETEEVEKRFSELESQETQIEKKIEEIEKQEASAKGSLEKRSLEKKRWKTEKKREELEKKRWSEDERIEQLENQLKSLEREGAETISREKELTLREQAINKEIKEIDLRIEKADLEEELKSIAKARALTEEKTNLFFQKLEEIKASLSKVSAEEGLIEEEKKKIEEKEKTAANLAERRKKEQERWQVEEKRRKIESNRWSIEEEKEGIQSELQNSQARLKNILAKKETMNDRINEINELLQGRAPEPKKEPVLASKEEPEKAPVPKEPPKKEEDLKGKSQEEKINIVEKERKDRIEEARKRIETLRKAALARKQRQEQMKKAVLPPVAKQKLSPKPVEEEPLKEERRKELMKRLRTPGQIYEKLYNKKDYSEKELKEAKRVPESQEIIRVVPKKPSFRERLWVRALIMAVTLVILAGILTFWYWYFRIRNQVPVHPPGYEKEREGVKISPALFTIPDTVIITIGEDEELVDSLEKLLDSTQRGDQFKRVVFKKAGDIVGLDQVFKALGIGLDKNNPKEFNSAFRNFFESIDKEATMFIYSQNQGNRFGFAVKVATGKEELNLILKSMEPTMDLDFENLFVLMGKEGESVAPYFKDARNISDYQGLNFRFKTLNENDLGICYAAFDYYFVFASSFEGMERALVEIENFLEDKVLLRDLKLGDLGDQVNLLQDWLIKEFSISAVDLTYGRFDDKTRKYVVDFQERYASEILLPNGLTKGTGIVDLETRKKLNELYSKI